MREFLDRPGSPGAFGALMDEYARAAGDFCRVVEGFATKEFEQERPGDDPDTVSARSVAEHVCRAAFGYASILREALRSEAEEPPAPAAVGAPGEVRPLLVRALRHTEAVGEPLRRVHPDEVIGNTFRVPWGQLYDPETLLEHAIVHLLRHRRQLERWRA
jgi:hypothetical protein